MKNIYLSNIRGILKTYVKFHLIMMNIKDVKPVSKTCIFFIQYVTLVTASNNELFFTIIIMYSLMKSACPLTNLFEGTCTPRGWILGVQGIF